MKNPTKKFLERFDKAIPGSSGFLYEKTRKFSKKNKSKLDFVTGLFQWAEKNSSAQLKKRKSFSKLTQRQVLEYQQNKCMLCSKKSKLLQYHHIDGDRSNNKPSNCVGLCPNCHAEKTRKKLD